MTIPVTFSRWAAVTEQSRMSKCVPVMPDSPRKRHQGRRNPSTRKAWVRRFSWCPAVSWLPVICICWLFQHSNTLTWSVKETPREAGGTATLRSDLGSVLGPDAPPLTLLGRREMVRSTGMDGNRTAERSQLLTAQGPSLQFRGPQLVPISQVQPAAPCPGLLLPVSFCF